MHRIFFWLLLALLPTQLGYHVWPAWAMVLGRRVDYLSPTLYLTDIFLLFTMGSWLLSFRTKRQRSEKSSEALPLDFSPSARNDRKIFVIIAVALFVAANIFFASNKFVAGYKWLKVLEFVGLGWYIVRTKPTLLAIVTPLSIGVLYSSVLAIAQFILQRSVGGPLWWLGERTFDAATPGIARTVWYGRELLRPYATFPHPNVLGGFLAAVLPLVLMSLMRPMSPMSQRKKLFYVIALVTGGIALVLTFSRSAIMIGTVAIASIFFYKRSLIVLCLVALAFLLFPFYFFLFTFSEESVVVRQQLNSAAMTLWHSSPLFGVGLGNFLVRLPEVLPTRTIYFLQPVHSIYLLMLAESGVVGLSALLWFLWHSFQNFKSQISNLKLSLLVFLLLGLVDHYPLTLQQGQLLLTVLIAMSYNRAHVT